MGGEFEAKESGRVGEVDVEQKMREGCLSNNNLTFSRNVYCYICTCCTNYVGQGDQRQVQWFLLFT